MADTSVKLPAGFTLDQPQPVRPPAGFTLDQAQPAVQPRPAPSGGGFLAESLSALPSLSELGAGAEDIGRGFGEVAKRALLGGRVDPQKVQPGIERIGDIGTFATGGLTSPIGPQGPVSFGRGAGKAYEQAISAPGYGEKPIFRTTQEKARDIISKEVGQATKSGEITTAGLMDQMTGARQEGQPLTLMDVGGLPTRRLAGSLYRTQGPAGEIVKKFLDDRDKAFVDLDTAAGARISGAVDKYVANGSMRQTAKALAAMRSENARPLWEKAMENRPIWSPRLQEFLEHPDIQQGLRRGWVIERRNALAEGRAMNPSDYSVTDFNEAGEPIITKVPNMKLLQVAKEGIDAMLDDPGMRDDFGRLTKAGRSVDAVRRSFLGELDSLNPNYKAARDQWSGDTASMRALKDGRQIFDKRSFTPEELRERWAEMPANDREFFRLGVADQLKFNLDQARLSGDESKAIINSSSDLKKMRTLFDKEEDFTKFVDFIKRERTMFETATDVMKGSQTQERSMSDAALSALHGFSRLLHSPLYAIPHFARAARSYLRPSEELNTEMARILTDPNVTLYSSPGQPLLGNPNIFLNPPTSP